MDACLSRGKQKSSRSPREGITGWGEEVPVGSSLLGPKKAKEKKNFNQGSFPVLSGQDLSLGLSPSNARILPLRSGLIHKAQSERIWAWELPAVMNGRDRCTDAAPPRWIFHLFLQTFWG